jgi:predicted TIM-barrel fold metal-dependent hydrolase
VLVDVQGRNNRNLYPLLAKLPNLYIETAGLNVHHGIEDVCRRFGAERLLFGSGYPIRSMGGALLQTRSADIDESEREMIASGNLRRLLGAVKTRGDHLARKATTD